MSCASPANSIAFTSGSHTLLILNGKLPDSSPVAVVVVGQTTVRVGLQTDGAADTDRLRAELARKEQEVRFLEEKLNNAAFTDRAPKAVVDRERARLHDAREAVKRLQRLLGQNGELR